MFKAGDIVICIEMVVYARPPFNTKELEQYIELYKPYEIEYITYSTGQPYLHFNGVKSGLISEAFMLFSDYRKMKLKKICSKMEI